MRDVLSIFQNQKYPYLEGYFELLYITVNFTQMFLLFRMEKHLSFPTSLENTAEKITCSTHALFHSLDIFVLCLSNCVSINCMSCLFIIIYIYK